MGGANPKALAIIRALLLTGARYGEIASGRPEYIDFQRGAALLPDSKTGTKTIPLGAPALEIFAEHIKDGAAWIFPAERGKGHYQGTPKIWREKIRDAAGLSAVRIHDLRHSFASVGVAFNQSLFIVGKILGHRRAETTQKYSHLQLDPVRAAAEQTSQRLAGALKGRKAANVVRLKRRRK